MAIFICPRLIRRGSGDRARVVVVVVAVVDIVLHRHQVFAEEPSFALVQKQGGPCAVLAPVQAHVMDQLLCMSGFPTLKLK